MMGRQGGVHSAPVRTLLLMMMMMAKVAPGQGAPGTGMPSGPAICRGGTERPCYKIVYLHDTARRVGFADALLACQRDGGDLLSIESQSEQHLIQKMIGSFSASDGDFWIGLTRQKDPDNNTECQSLYSWSDGSAATFRNWYADEPSCGSEVCVVMYHQPSAPEGDGGPYMFQWNDDRCNIRNNFICKYSQEKLTTVPEMNTPLAGVTTESSTLTSPDGPIEEDITSKILKETKETSWSLLYILVLTIPVLLLTLVITAIFCFWLYTKRRREQTEVNKKEGPTWGSPQRQPKSPSLEIYNVIKGQTEADLAGTRPDIKNTSFRVRGGGEAPDDLSGDYDNMAVHVSESGFVTLASMESGFVANDIYELCGDRVGQSKESTWVENDIYGY